jgi:hypothetical protein
MESVKQNGHALRFADESLKRDYEILIEVVMHGYSLTYADVSINGEKEDRRPYGDKDDR